ncbi:hypothetical protein [Amycolatopsis alkalitolerans]|uniref:hypothetical protein n=1 Tax=Amycolatopsis alkalitolerans TaxID=2547244 RepID=UPI001F1B536B|nr:hypothetical protein [Amycolatopsis alkalitolerans]
MSGLLTAQHLAGWGYPGAPLKTTALGIGVQGAAYIGSTFISIYLVTDLHYPKSPVYWITAGVTW